MVVSRNHCDLHVTRWIVGAKDVSMRQVNAMPVHLENCLTRGSYFGEPGRWEVELNSREVR